MLNPRLGTLAAMVLAAAGTRLLPHPPNMTSLTALALFGGALFTNRWLAFVLPLTALLLSDLLLGWYWSWSIMAYQPYMGVQYCTFALIVAVGFSLRRQRSPWRVAGATLSASVLFFIITNFGEWALQPLYPKTVGGLAACFIAAIPFFGNSLSGDAFYSLLLFGGFHLLETRFGALRELPRAAASI